MLESAPDKAKNRNMHIQFSEADVMNLPFTDKKFDVCSISFGIRNVADPVKALSEMARVTKSGGTVMVLEFGQVDIPGFAGLYNFYSEKVLPVIGGWVTGQKEAYQYLQKSSAAFPCKAEFLGLMDQTKVFEKTEFGSRMVISKINDFRII